MKSAESAGTNERPDHIADAATGAGMEATHVAREGLKTLDADPPRVQMVLSYRLAATFGDDSV